MPWRSFHFHGNPAYTTLGRLLFASCSKKEENAVPRVAPGEQPVHRLPEEPVTLSNTFGLWLQLVSLSLLSSLSDCLSWWHRCPNQPYRKTFAAPCEFVRGVSTGNPGASVHLCLVYRFAVPWQSPRFLIFFSGCPLSYGAKPSFFSSLSCEQRLSRFFFRTGTR